MKKPINTSAVGANNQYEPHISKAAWSFLPVLINQVALSE
jgi:hypothetical protein